MKLIILVFIIVTTIFGEIVVIQNGTVVVVKTVGQLSSRQLSMGQTIILDVAQDVIINGKVVIKAGAPVYGIVQDAKGGQMAGIAGKISIALNSTVAVDGTNIAISGSFSRKGDSEIGETIACAAILCPLALLNTGDEGVIPIGAQTRAMTLGTVNVKTN